MCFRPTNAAKAIPCVECGAYNKPDNEVCQKCGADFEASRKAAEAAAAPAVGGPAAGGAPGAPGAPKSPGAAPKAPGGPK